MAFRGTSAFVCRGNEEDSHDLSQGVVAFHFDKVIHDPTEVVGQDCHPESQQSRCDDITIMHGAFSSQMPGQLAVGTCEIVMLNRDSSQPKRTIARQTARCACRRGQIAGTTRARPACVDARIVKSKQWCEMSPCSEGEICGLLFNRSGWTCTKGGGRIKTVTVRHNLNI
ncbi:hypothetical protein cypCar_00012981, partial [Cyprinus carpio]